MVNFLLLFLCIFWRPSQKHQELSLYWPQKSLFPRETEHAEAPSPGRDRPSVLTAHQRETACARGHDSQPKDEEQQQLSATQNCADSESQRVTDQTLLLLPELKLEFGRAVVWG